MKTKRLFVERRLHGVERILSTHSITTRHAANSFKSFDVKSSELPLIIKTDNAPIHLYASEVEEQAMHQVYALANSDIPVGPVAIMPDVHWGKGSVVGAVFANKTKICPMAVGVDIGCGMTAIKMKNIKKHDLSNNMRLMWRIQNGLKSKIPVGFNSHKSLPPNAVSTINGIPDNADHCRPSNWLHRYVQRDSIIAHQLGTLGGGNHFIEVLHEDLNHWNDPRAASNSPRNDSHRPFQSHGQQRKVQRKYDGNEESDIWLMLHSGSRRIGNHTASHWEEVGKMKYTRTGRDPLHWLPIDSRDGEGYINDMNWCQQYAFKNREFMLNAMIEVMAEECRVEPDWNTFINIHHNHCRCEVCSYRDNRSGEWIKDEQLWVTRKGATSARKGEIGIIPGNMAHGSYIVEGMGNEQSWKSCSHGSGRRMGRIQAKKEILQRDFIKQLDDAKIVCDRDSRLRDEAPQAYKDLHQVINAQVEANVVKIRHRLLPLINVKGF